MLTFSIQLRNASNSNRYRGSLYMGLPNRHINPLLQTYQKFLIAAKMRVDLFGRESKQVVPTTLLNAPLF